MSGAPASSEPAAALNPRRRSSLIGLSAVTALVWVTASDVSIALHRVRRGRVLHARRSGPGIPILAGMVLLLIAGVMRR